MVGLRLGKGRWARIRKVAGEVAGAPLVPVEGEIAVNIGAAIDRTVAVVVVEGLHPMQQGH